ncbi:MAG: hypothetical protein ACFFB2_16480 [Promethearchaeota archaeon]
MYSDFTYIRKQEPNRNDKAHEALLNNPIQESVKIREELRDDLIANRLADRALLLLSFKDTSTQNLRYVLNVLGIRTLEEKRNILQEIYRLIREGIIYVPRGLPQLIDYGSCLDIHSPFEADNIDLCLLRPFEELIKEFQNELSQIQIKKPINSI